MTDEEKVPIIDIGLLTRKIFDQFDSNKVDFARIDVHEIRRGEQGQAEHHKIDITQILFHGIEPKYLRTINYEASISKGDDGYGKFILGEDVTQLESAFEKKKYKVGIIEEGACAEHKWKIFVCSDESKVLDVQAYKAINERKITPDKAFSILRRIMEEKKEPEYFEHFDTENPPIPLKNAGYIVKDGSLYTEQKYREFLKNTISDLIREGNYHDFRQQVAETNKSLLFKIANVPLYLDCPLEGIKRDQSLDNSFKQEMDGYYDYKKRSLYGSLDKFDKVIDGVTQYSEIEKAYLILEMNELIKEENNFIKYRNRIAGLNEKLFDSLNVPCSSNEPGKKQVNKPTQGKLFQD